MNILTKPRAIALASSATVALAMLAGPASAAASGTYNATISPAAVTSGTQATYTVLFKNNSLLSSLIGYDRATVTVPAGFTGITVGTASPSRWHATYNAGTRTVTLTSGLLLPGQFVSVPITATAPTVTGNYVWPTTASSTLTGPATLSGPPPTVQVANSVVFCPANQTCDSGPLSAPASGGTLATDAEVLAKTGTAADVLITNLPDPTTSSMSCQQPGFGAIVSWTVKSRATTLTYTIHPTSDAYSYDQFDTCFGSPKDFKQADGSNAPFNGANNEFEGTIPLCQPQTTTATGHAALAATTNPPPCVVSIAVNYEQMPSPVTFVIDAPVDAKYTG
jgi:hypothetical protein